MALFGRARPRRTAWCVAPRASRGRATLPFRSLRVPVPVSAPIGQVLVTLMGFMTFHVLDIPTTDVIGYLLWLEYAVHLASAAIVAVCPSILHASSTLHKSVHTE